MATTPESGDTEYKLIWKICEKTAGLTGGGGGGGSGTVTSFSFTNANGITGIVTNATTTPNLTLSLGAITPSSIVTNLITAVDGFDQINLDDGTLLAGGPLAVTVNWHNGELFDLSGVLRVDWENLDLIGNWDVTGDLTVSGHFESNTASITGAIDAGDFIGDLTGNADTVTFADAGGDTTTFVALGTAATGSLPVSTDAGLTYNATTNVLTSTGGFVGNVTGSATSVPISGLTAATASNSIDNLNFAQTWTWSTQTTGSALTLVDGGLTSGSMLTITSTSAAGITGLSGLKIAMSGANNGASQVTTGLDITNVRTGATSQSIAIRASTSGATLITDLAAQFIGYNGGGIKVSSLSATSGALFSNNVTPTATNYMIGGDGAITNVNATSSIGLTISNANNFVISSPSTLTLSRSNSGSIKMYPSQDGIGTSVDGAAGVWLGADFGSTTAGITFATLGSKGNIANTTGVSRGVRSLAGYAPTSGTGEAIGHEVFGTVASLGTGSYKAFNVFNTLTAQQHPNYRGYSINVTSANSSQANGIFRGYEAIYTINNTGTTSGGVYNAFYADITETSLTGTTHNLADWKIGGNTKFRVTNLGGLYCANVIVPSAATPVTVAAVDSNVNYTNEGAAAKIVFNLPTAVAGYTYTFVVQDADGIDVTAAAGDTIRFAGTVTAAAGTITSTTIGSTITLVAINATEWIATSLMGTWA